MPVRNGCGHSASLAERRKNMEWYINNRELIKNLAINTGTELNPTYTTICTIDNQQGTNI